MTMVDEIKRTIRLSEIAMRYGELRKRGQLQVCRCLCGENNDRNPSFTLYERGQADDHYHCFACGRHGSVIDLVILVEHLDFKAACRLLCDQFMKGRSGGFSARAIARQSSPPQSTDVLPEVKDLLEAAVAHYVATIENLPTMLNQLKERGVNFETRQRLSIGFADGTLARHLHASGKSLSLASQIGLIGSRGELLHNRIVFPIYNDVGEIAFLIGRATQVKQSPKYLGLPAGLVHKIPMCAGQSVHGVIVVEGPIDLAALVQWGVDQNYLIIALLGTAYGRALEIIRECLPERVLMALDQDDAGDRAARDLQSALSTLGILTNRLTWQGAKDCGELLQQGDSGRMRFLERLSQFSVEIERPIKPEFDVDVWLESAYDDSCSDAT